MLHLKDSDAPNQAMFMSMHMKIWHALDNKLQMMMHWQGFDIHIIKLAKGTCSARSVLSGFVFSAMVKANLSETCETLVAFSLALTSSTIRPS